MMGPYQQKPMEILRDQAFGVGRLKVWHVPSTKQVRAEIIGADGRQIEAKHLTCENPDRKWEAEKQLTREALERPAPVKKEKWA